jgi:hypothetical protein
MRIGEDRKNGYLLESFRDAFKRYIPSTPPHPTVPTYQCNNINNIDEKQSVPNNNDGTDEKQHKPLKSLDWYDGTVQKGGTEEDIPLVLKRIHTPAHVSNTG